MENFENFEIAQDVRQTTEYGSYIRSIGWNCEVVSEGNISVQVFVRKMGPVAIAKIQRTNLPLPINELRKFLKGRKVIMCKLEPQINQNDEEMQSVKKLGFRQDKWPLLASKTLRVDLKPSLEKIEMSFKKDARYCLKKSRLSAVEIRQNEWDLFYEIWKKSAKNKDIWILSKDHLNGLKSSFGEAAFCLTAGKMAGVVVLVVGGAAYYYFSAALPEAKELQLPYRLIWEAMVIAKKRGAKVWDFEGIFDPRWPTKSWKGFTHFKRSFGGQEITFPGSFVRWGWW